MQEPWNITAKKKLIEKGISLKELSEVLNVNYSVLSAVLNGKTIREKIRVKICEYLEV